VLHVEISLTAKVLFSPMRDMMNSNGKAKFSLHIESGLVLGDAVPAAVLSLILKNIRKFSESRMLMT
jgi:hypothetical protein